MRIHIDPLGGVTVAKDWQHAPGCPDPFGRAIGLYLDHGCWRAYGKTIELDECDDPGCDYEEVICGRGSEISYDVVPDGPRRPYTPRYRQN